jgi:heme-degrading monooxygenase HmoA
MSAVMTILEADVPGEKWPELQAAFTALSDSTPGHVLQNYLVQGMDGRDTWCVVTVWHSLEDFEEYQRSEGVPAAVKLFGRVGAEPVMATFTVVDQS